MSVWGWEGGGRGGGSGRLASATSCSAVLYTSLSGLLPRPWADTLVDMGVQRISFDYSDLVVGTGNTVVLERAISDLAQRFDMQWQLNYSGKLKRVALLVSKIDHCLYDILIRHRSGVIVSRSGVQGLDPMSDYLKSAYLPSVFLSTAISAFCSVPRISDLNENLGPYLWPVQAIFLP